MYCIWKMLPTLQQMDILIWVVSDQVQFYLCWRILNKYYYGCTVVCGGGLNNSRRLFVVFSKI